MRFYTVLIQFLITTLGHASQIPLQPSHYGSGVVNGHNIPLDIYTPQISQDQWEEHIGAETRDQYFMRSTDHKYGTTYTFIPKTKLLRQNAEEIIAGIYSITYYPDLGLALGSNTGKLVGLTVQPTSYFPEFVATLANAAPSSSSHFRFNNIETKQTEYTIPLAKPKCSQAIARVIRRQGYKAHLPVNLDKKEVPMENLWEMGGKKIFSKVTGSARDCRIFIQSISNQRVSK